MNSKYILPLAAFLGLSVLLGIGLTMNPQELPSALINKPAPEFSTPLLDVPSANFSPSDLKGQRWILNVWASWCPSCRYEHPIFNEIGAKTSIPLVGFNYKDKPQDATRWLVQRGNPYDKVPVDINGDIALDWGVYGAPETFVIDEQGLILFRHAGPIDRTLMREKIAPFFPELQALYKLN